MSNVKALNEKCLTPEMVMENISKEDVAHFYAVTVDSKGRFSCWASGDLGRFSDAALYMNRVAASSIQSSEDDDE